MKDIADRFGPETAAAVDAMSHRDGEAWSDYIDRVAANPVARQVKISDLIDNSNLSRISCFGDSLTWGDDPGCVGHRLPHRWPVSLQSALDSDYVVVEEGQCDRNIATDDVVEGEKNGLMVKTGV